MGLIGNKGPMYDKNKRFLKMNNIKSRTLFKSFMKENGLDFNEDPINLDLINQYKSTHIKNKESDNHETLENLPFSSEHISVEKEDFNILAFLKHSLFYSEVDGKFLFSSVKFIIISLLIVGFYCIYAANDFKPDKFFTSVFVTLLFSSPLLIVFAIYHKFFDKQIKLKREDSLKNDILHFLLYRYDEKADSFSFSKPNWFHS